MYNPRHAVILGVYIHNVMQNINLMVSMLVNISTAENTLDVMKNTDLSTSRTHINIASIRSSG